MRIYHSKGMPSFSFQSQLLAFDSSDAFSLAVLVFCYCFRMFKVFRIFANTAGYEERITMKVAFLPTLGLLSFPTAISQGLLVTTVSIPYCPTPAASGLGTETYGGDGGFGANGTSVSYGSSEEGSPPSTTYGALLFRPIRC